MVHIKPINLEIPNLRQELNRFQDDWTLVSGFGNWSNKYTKKQLTQLWIFHAGNAVKEQLAEMKWDNPGDEFDLEKVKAKLLSAHHQKTLSLVHFRNQFFNCVFKEGESFDQYYTRLTRLAYKSRYIQQ